MGLVGRTRGRRHLETRHWRQEEACEVSGGPDCAETTPVEVGDTNDFPGPSQELLCLSNTRKRSAWRTAAFGNHLRPLLHCAERFRNRHIELFRYHRKLSSSTRGHDSSCVTIRGSISPAKTQERSRGHSSARPFHIQCRRWAGARNAM
jgi:hypothetical protein